MVIPARGLQTVTPVVVGAQVEAWLTFPSTRITSSSKIASGRMEFSHFRDQLRGADQLGNGARAAPEFAMWNSTSESCCHQAKSRVEARSYIRVLSGLRGNPGAQLETRVGCHRCRTLAGPTEAGPLQGEARRPSALDTLLPLSSGAFNMALQASECGSMAKTSVNVAVTSKIIKLV